VSCGDVWEVACLCVGEKYRKFVCLFVCLINSNFGF